ncbi:alpha-amylase family protein [Paenibacillus oryzisoli]|uniref:beta-galactosidase trimerization domain-containing protein n=1 Tax=Paenibacillus oryzisoli TaxID=1850517 RepID=UPI003D26FB7C
MTELKWYQKPLRIIDFIPPDPDRYETLDIGEQIRIRQALGFNVDHVEVHDVTVGESAITFYPSDYAHQTRRNMLGELTEGYKGSGVMPVVYFNVHWLSPSLLEPCPDWFQQDDAGQIIPSGYGLGGYTCVNSPFREYALGTITTIAQYAIGGIFLDGPIFRIEGCRCAHCRALFAEQYGYEMPATSTKEKREQADLAAFKKQSIADFVRVSREALRRVRPDAIIYMNNLQLLPDKYCSRDNRLTGEHQDMLLAEGGFLHGDLRQIPIWKPAATAMLLETQAKGKPYCVAIAGRQAPWSRYLLSVSETWLVHAMAAAHGASTWYGTYNDNNSDARMRTVQAINRFFSENEPYYTQTASAAKIAMLWSRTTANQYQSSADVTDFTDEQRAADEQRKGDARASFLGMFDALSRSRVIFDIVDEEAVSDGTLDRYELLILPNISCMSEQTAASIRAFVQGGGRILSTFDTSFYDESGERYAQPVLADVMGLARVQDISACAYDHITVKADEPLLRGIDQSQLPAAGLGAKVVPLPTAATSLAYREPQVSRYSELPDETAYPYIVTHAYGSGSSLYFAGNVDKFYGDFALDEYRKLLSNAVESLSKPPVEVTAEVDLTSIHLSLRKQQGRMMLHLVHYSGSQTRPIGAVIPLRDVRIRLQVPVAEGCAGVQAVKSLRSGAMLPFSYSDGMLSVTLEELREYEVVVVELV